MRSLFIQQAKTVVYVIMLLNICFVSSLYGLEDLIKKIHPGLEDLNKKLIDLEKERQKLPLKQLSNRSTQFGYHSSLFFSETHEHWVMIDLLEESEMELMAIIPAYVQTTLYDDMDYGFPSEFRVEVLSEGMEVHWSSSFEKPLAGLMGSPFFIECPESCVGRYVKITTLKHWKTMEHWTTAFSEVMIFKDGLNIASHAKVSSLDRKDLTLPGWSPDYLTDNQSPLGPPVSKEASPSNGTLISRSGKNKNSDIYLILDLENPVNVDQIVLYPSRPTDYADAPGSGFPRRYKVEGSLDKNFESPILFYETGEVDDVNPGDNPVIIEAKENRVQFLRISAQKYYDRPNRSSMSFAEVEVYSDMVNVAFGRKVESPYKMSFDHYPRWYPEALVDGYNSQNKLLPYVTWLKGLVKDRELDLKYKFYQNLYHNEIQKTQVFLISAFITLITLALITLLYFFIKANREKKLIQKKIREQISRDLHDEIGSQLGGIALLSESHLNSEKLSSDLREDLEQISQVAYASGDSMKDIIWLISEEKRSLLELGHQFKMISKRILAGLPFEMETNFETSKNIVIDLQESRHLTLFLKEALHNIVKHAKADKVNINLVWDDKTHRLNLHIQDNGQGFDTKQAKAGNGLKNFQKRAELMRAEFKIQSSEGQGTSLDLKVKLT